MTRGYRGRNNNVYANVLAFVLLLILLSFIFKSYSKYFIIAAIISGFATLIYQPAGEIIASLWMQLAAFLGSISNAVLLGLVFIIFLPLVKLFKPPAREKKKSASRTSNFKTPDETGPVDFTRPW